MINPVAPFYEFYLALTTSALPSVFMTFFGMSIAVFIVLALFSLFWRIR